MGSFRLFARLVTDLTLSQEPTLCHLVSYDWEQITKLWYNLRLIPSERFQRMKE